MRIRVDQKSVRQFEAAVRNLTNTTMASVYGAGSMACARLIAQRTRASTAYQDVTGRHRRHIKAIPYGMQMGDPKRYVRDSSALVVSPISYSAPLESIKPYLHPAIREVKGSLETVFANAAREHLQGAVRRARQAGKT